MLKKRYKVDVNESLNVTDISTYDWAFRANEHITKLNKMVEGKATFESCPIQKEKKTEKKCPKSY